MGKSKQIFQKLNVVLFLLMALLTGVALVQGFLKNGQNIELFLGAFLVPWIIFLGILIGDLILAGKKIREYLEENNKIRRILEGVAVSLSILGILGVCLYLKGQMSFGENGQMLLTMGESIKAGNLLSASPEVVEYLSRRPGELLYGWLLLGMTKLISDSLMAGFVLQMVLLAMVLVVAYFCMRKIGGRASALGCVCLIGVVAVFKKSVFIIDVQLLYLAFLLLSVLLLVSVFAKRDVQEKFTIKDLILLILSGVFLAIATMFELQTIFLVIPCLCFIWLSGRKVKEEEADSVLECRGIRCLIFFFIYGIATVMTGLIFALCIQHILRLSLPLDSATWSVWLTSSLDGILGFFYKLEELFLGGHVTGYGYGLVLGLILMAFVQAIILLFKKENSLFVPAYLVNCLLIIELVLKEQAGAGLVLIVFVCVLGSGLFGNVYDVVLASRLKKEKLDEKYESILAVSQVAAKGPVEIKDVIEEKIVAAEAEAVKEPTKAVVEKPVDEEISEVAATEEKMEESVEIIQLKEKLESMEAMMASQQMRIARMEERMKEQRLLAKKRERRLRQELAIARNRGISSSDRIKR